MFVAVYSLMMKRKRNILWMPISYLDLFFSVFTFTESERMFAIKFCTVSSCSRITSNKYLRE